MKKATSKPVPKVRTHLPNAPPLPISAIDLDLVGPSWPSVWWVGCHGGAGTTTVARATGIGVDARRTWPSRPENAPPVQVVLVCRATSLGLWAATGAVEQWRRQAVPLGTHLLGVAVVAGSPAKQPRIVRERVRLIRGWVPQLWQVQWQELYLAVDDPIDVGTPPDVAELRQAVGKAAAKNATINKAGTR